MSGLADAGGCFVKRSMRSDERFGGSKLELAIFREMLIGAYWQPGVRHTRFGDVPLRRGQYLTSARQIGQDFEISKTRAATMLRRWEAAGLIRCNSNHDLPAAGTIIEIVGYDDLTSIGSGKGGVVDRGQDPDRGGAGAAKNADTGADRGPSVAASQNQGDKRPQPAAAGQGGGQVSPEARTPPDEIADTSRKNSTLQEGEEAAAARERSRSDLEWLLAELHARKVATGGANRSVVNAWLAEGIDPRGVIIPAVERVRARERLASDVSKPAKYFDGAVREDHAKAAATCAAVDIALQRLPYGPNPSLLSRDAWEANRRAAEAQATPDILPNGRLVRRPFVKMRLGLVAGFRQHAGPGPLQTQNPEDERALVDEIAAGIEGWLKCGAEPDDFWPLVKAACAAEHAAGRTVDSFEQIDAIVWPQLQARIEMRYAAETGADNAPERDATAKPSLWVVR